MSKIKNDGLDQYDAEPFKQRQFWTAGTEGVNVAGVLDYRQFNDEVDTWTMRGELVRKHDQIWFTGLSRNTRFKGEI